MLFYERVERQDPDGDGDHEARDDCHGHGHGHGGDTHENGAAVEGTGVNLAATVATGSNSNQSRPVGFHLPNPCPPHLLGFEQELWQQNQTQMRRNQLAGPGMLQFVLGTTQPKV